ncbi:hypothetical protein ACSSS7_000684 [Eimeria intestinalis]
MDEQEATHLASIGGAEGSSSKLKDAALRSLRLFDARTPRTSASVRGRWTAEFQVIKAALLRQRTAKNKALRGPTTCSCCRSKGPSGHNGAFASAAAQASEAFAEVARLTPRRANDKTAPPRLWGPGLVASSDEAAAEAAAAAGALQGLNKRRLSACKDQPPELVASLSPPTTRVPAFLWKEYFDTPTSRAALSYREAARVMLPLSRTREAKKASSQSRTDSHQQAGPQVPPASFFLTAPNPPVLEAAASPETPASLGSARRRSISHPAKQLCPLSLRSESGQAIAPQKGRSGEQQQRKGVSEVATAADALRHQSRGVPGKTGKTGFPGSSFWRKSVDPPPRANDPVAAKAKASQAPAADNGYHEGVRSLAAELLRKLSRARGSRMETTLGSESQRQGRSEERKKKRHVFQRPQHSVELSSERSKALDAVSGDSKRSRLSRGKKSSAKFVAVTGARQRRASQRLASVTATKHPQVGASAAARRTGASRKSGFTIRGRGNHFGVRLHQAAWVAGFRCTRSIRIAPLPASAAVEGFLRCRSSLTSASSPMSSNSTSSSPSSGDGCSSQPSVKLEKLLAEADEAFWVSQKLDHMVGWLANRTRRATSPGKLRRSFFGSANAAGRNTLSPELLQQQLNQLIARSSPTAGPSDARQANRPDMATSLEKPSRLWSAAANRRGGARSNQERETDRNAESVGEAESEI